MDKKELKQIPISLATNKFVKLMNISTTKAIFSTEIHNNIFVLNIFGRDNLLSNERRPAYRAFFHKEPNEICLQKIEGDKTKWLSTKLANNEFIPGSHEGTVYSDELSDICFSTKKDIKNISSFFSRSCSDLRDSFNAILEFEQKIRIAISEQKKKAAKQMYDDIMEQEFSYKVPKKFFNWAKKYALPQYLYYKRDKKQIECTCTNCKKSFTVSENSFEVLPKHLDETFCPNCHFKLTALSIGRTKNAKYDHVNAAHFLQTDDGFKIRYFHISRTISSETVNAPRIHITESLRTVNRNGVATRYENRNKGLVYGWWDSPQNGLAVRYYTIAQPVSGLEAYGDCKVYPESVKELSGELKYMDLSVLNPKKQTARTCFFETLINFYLENPEGVEKVLKSGYINIITPLIEGTINHTDLSYNKKNLYEITGLNRTDYKFARDNNLDIFKLKVLRWLNELKVIWSPEQLNSLSQLMSYSYSYYYTVGGRFKFLEEVLKETSLTSFLNWVRRTEYDSEHLLTDYRDYLSDLHELSYIKNVKEEDKYYLYPKNFKEAHDKLNKEVMEHRNKIEAEKRRKIEEAMALRTENAKKIVAEVLSAGNNDISALHSKNLMIRIPASAEEIKEEGINQHNCVGGYVNRIARGETFVFFIRKIEAPNESFVTVEWRDEIVQVRAAHNNSAPEEAKTLAEAFDLRLKKAGITLKKLTESYGIELEEEKVAI